MVSMSAQTGPRTHTAPSDSASRNLGTWHIQSWAEHLKASDLLIMFRSAHSEELLIGDIEYVGRYPSVPTTLE